MLAVAHLVHPGVAERLHAVVAAPARAFIKPARPIVASRTQVVFLLPSSVAAREIESRVSSGSLPAGSRDPNREAS